ncbi:Vgll3 [Columba guinea]|nr:Vgll3 [Columba guinea]
MLSMFQDFFEKSIDEVSSVSEARWHSDPEEKKLAVYNKMQESLEVTLPSKQEEDEKDQPAEMEYLNSRCVLFTYFQGDIGSVVDEHFSRALSQVSSFSPETALTKSKAGLNPLWRGSEENERLDMKKRVFAFFVSPDANTLNNVHFLS